MGSVEPLSHLNFIRLADARSATNRFSNILGQSPKLFHQAPTISKDSDPRMCCKFFQLLPTAFEHFKTSPNKFLRLRRPQDSQETPPPDSAHFPKVLHFRKPRTLETILEHCPRAPAPAIKITSGSGPIVPTTATPLNYPLSLGTWS